MIVPLIGVKKDLIEAVPCVAFLNRFPIFFVSKVNRVSMTVTFGIGGQAEKLLLAIPTA